MLKNSRMPKKKEEKAMVHKDLEGFDIKIDAFGNIQANFPIDRIKDFLDKNLEDKKLPRSNQEEEEE